MSDKRALTLAEVMVCFFVIGIIAGITIMVNMQKNDQVQKYMYYAAVMNLKSAVGQMIAEDRTNLGKLLPAAGAGTNGLCNLLIRDIINIVGAANCSATTATSTTNFATATPNFTTSNGMRFYNFGATPVGSIYTIFVDIDGVRANSKSTLNTDVFKFTINRNGEVLPDHLLPATAANNLNYISAGVTYLVGTPTGVQIRWALQDVTYRTALCASREVEDGTFCTGVTIGNANCLTKGVCKVVIKKPLKEYQ